LIIHDATNEPLSLVIGFLAPFVSGFNLTLTRLKIASLCDLPTSFFDRLGYFPRLIKLELSIRAIDLSFTRFITRHAATLNSLSLAVGQACWAKDEAEATLQTVRDAFTVSPPFEFPRLQTLQLALAFSLHRLHSMSLATCIRPFVDTLTALILKKPYIRGELDIVLSAFSHNPGVLTSASLDLEILSPRTVDLLAKHCPGLTDLKLGVQWITGDDDDSEVRPHDF
jgi:hypothetical protein